MYLRQGNLRLGGMAWDRGSSVAGILITFERLEDAIDIFQQS